MAKPVADFTFTPNTGSSPLTVTFTDTSSGNPTNWEWDFGDGSNSSDQNPIHVYKNIIDQVTSYTVTLIVVNATAQSSDPASEIVVVQGSSEFPIWAIVLIALLGVTILFLIVFLPLYFKHKHANK